MNTKYYDVIVAGAGPAGICAAVAAARHHQHQRPVDGAGHPLAGIPQVNGQRPAADKFQLFQLHFAFPPFSHSLRFIIAQNESFLNFL